MSLSRNAALTMASAVLQIAVTLITLPMYLNAIGLERYGMLVLIWLGYEYLLLFNFSLDRAAIKYLSQSKNDVTQMNRIFWTAITICSVTSVAAAILVYFVSNVIIKSWFNFNPELFIELGVGLWAITITLVIGIVGTIFSSLLQANERFLELNLAQLAMAVAFQVLPLAAAVLISPRLEVVIVVGCVARSLQTILYVIFALKRKYRTGRPLFSRPDAHVLMRYGAWASVSGVISPIVVNLDRVLIATLSGAAAVATYVVPYNLVMKAQLLPTSLAAVLFPRLSQPGDDKSQNNTAVSALFVLGMILSIGLIIGSFLLEPFMVLWIKGVVTNETIWVGQLLILGIWFNGLAIIPFTWLQAGGHPDRVAKIHAMELLPYALLLWTLVHYFGIVGAAVAWTVRVAIDSMALFWLAGLNKSLRGLIPALLAVLAAVIFNCISHRHGTLRLVIGASLTATLIGWATLIAPLPIRNALTQQIRRLPPLRRRKS